MTKPAFTPGPWPIPTGYWAKNGNVCYELPGVKYLSKPDALLISAAPDLFYALQTLIGPIEGMQANLDAAKAARAALKKATGETK